MASTRLVGRLASGIGRGRAFTGLDWARAQFVDKLGIDPYPGTANVIVDDPDSAPAWVRLKRESAVAIDNPGTGPNDCDAKCWPVIVDGRIEGAIVLPLVENYPPAQVEVIAGVGLRDALGIEDGDTVTLVVEDRP